MPAAILKARTHRTSTVGTVTIDAVVRDEELRSDCHRSLVTFVRIPEHQRLPTQWKTGWQILVMSEQAKTVTTVRVSRSTNLFAGRCSLRTRISARRHSMNREDDGNRM
jgi:hypothetical protein